MPDKKPSRVPKVFDGIKTVVGWVVFWWQITPAVLLVSAGVLLGYLNNIGWLDLSLWALWTFVGLLLVTCGFLFLRDRRRAHKVTITHETAFGLAYSNLGWGLDVGQPDNALQAQVNLVNVTTGPLKYHVSRVDVILESRAMPEGKFTNRGGSVPRGMSRTFRCPPFPLKEIEHLIGKPSDGIIEMWVKYGPAEGLFERRLHLKLSLRFTILESGVRWADTILVESDVPLERAGDQIDE